MRQKFGEALYTFDREIFLGCSVCPAFDINSIYSFVVGPYMHALNDMLSGDFVLLIQDSKPYSLARCSPDGITIEEERF